MHLSCSTLTSHMPESDGLQMLSAAGISKAEPLRVGLTNRHEPVSLPLNKSAPSFFQYLYIGFPRQFANELRLANAPIKTLDLVGEYHSTIQPASPARLAW